MPAPAPAARGPPPRDIPLLTPAVTLIVALCARLAWRALEQPPDIPAAVKEESPPLFPGAAEAAARGRPLGTEPAAGGGNGSGGGAASAAVWDAAERGVWLALAGDALGMQTQHEYSLGRIRFAHPTDADLGAALRHAGAGIPGVANAPGLSARNWYPRKEAGDNTHVGDCIVMAVGYLAARAGAWDPAGYDAAWGAWITGYDREHYITGDMADARERREGGASGAAASSDGAAETAALCALPALALAGAADAVAEAGGAPGACDWSGCEWSAGYLATYAARNERAYPSVAAAIAECDALGPHLCGGVTCAGETACTVREGAGGVRPSPSGELSCVRPAAARGCGGGDAAAARRAVESVLPSQHAEWQFVVARFLSVVTLALLRRAAHEGAPPSRLEREGILYSAASSPLLGDLGGRIMNVTVRAAVRKAWEVDEALRRTDYGADPALQYVASAAYLHLAAGSVVDATTADDVALQTLGTSPGAPGAVPVPCRRRSCESWAEYGKDHMVDAGIASTLYLWLRHGSAGAAAALPRNAMLGGDAAGRGMLLGMLLGLGGDELPAHWRAQLRSRDRVRDLLRRVRGAG